MTDRTYADWQIDAAPGAREVSDEIARLRAERLDLRSAQDVAAGLVVRASVAQRKLAPNGGHVSEWAPRADVDPEAWAEMRQSADAATAALKANEVAERQAKKRLDSVMETERDQVVEAAAALVEPAQAEAVLARDALRDAVARRDASAAMSGTPIRRLSLNPGETLTRAFQIIDEHVAALGADPRAWTYTTVEGAK